MIDKEDTMVERMREMRAAFDAVVNEVAAMTSARFRRLLAWLKRGQSDA